MPHLRINVFNPNELQYTMSLDGANNFENLEISGEFHGFSVDGVGTWDLLVPNTVYPPREDTVLLSEAIAGLRRTEGTAVEIGCGSGAVSIVLASLGWKVTSCDVNPFAVAATKGNLERYGMHEHVEVLESGIGEGMELPSGTSLVVWNLPYLEATTLRTGLDAMEEASLTDICDGGWSNALLNYITNQKLPVADDCLILLLFRTDPPSSSTPLDWRMKGWSARSIASLRLGGEKLEVFAIWKPGSGIEPIILESCDSTMDEVKNIEEDGWQRVFSKKQISGRGRRGSVWKSSQEDISATWALSPEVTAKVNPGVLQTSIGAIVSETLQASVKWPNDIISSDYKKMGGILVESSGGERIRVGIGVNSRGFDGDGFSASGWNGTLGELSRAQVFERIDAIMASYYEDNGWLQMPSLDEMISISWNGISRVLSRGASIEVDGTVVRPCGLTENGEIETTGEHSSKTIRDLDRIRWLF